MKLTSRQIEVIVLLVLACLTVLVTLAEPLLAVSLVRVMVSLSPILLTVGTRLIFKWLFRL